MRFEIFEQAHGGRVMVDLDDIRYAMAEEGSDLCQIITSTDCHWVRTKLDDVKAAMAPAPKPEPRDACTEAERATSHGIQLMNARIDELCELDAALRVDSDLTTPTKEYIAKRLGRLNDWKAALERLERKG